MEVIVFGENAIAVLFGKIPNRFIRCLFQMKISQVMALWKSVSDGTDDPSRDVLIEKELHLPLGGQKSLFSIGCVFIAGLDVLFRQFGILLENGLGRHAGRQPFEDIINGDAHTANAWFAGSFIRFNSDALLECHVVEIRRICPALQAFQTVETAHKMRGLFMSPMVEGGALRAET